MALIEERTAIARELHDSIAQSLSFTKIAGQPFSEPAGHRMPTGHARKRTAGNPAGIQSAYAQLRELLTTFRLQLDRRGCAGLCWQRPKSLRTRARFRLVWKAVCKIIR